MRRPQAEAQFDSLFDKWLRFSVDGELQKASAFFSENGISEGDPVEGSKARDFFELGPRESEAYFGAWVASLKGSASSAVLRLRGEGLGECQRYLFYPQMDAQGKVEAVVLGSLRSIAESGANDSISTSDHSALQGRLDHLTESNASLEKALASANREIEQMRKECSAKTNFLANMSHEIRTPMNAVIGFCDLLSNTSPSPEQEEYISAISQSGRLLIKLIGQVLDYSKIDSGTLEFEKEEIDFSALLLEVQSMIGVRYNVDNVDFSMKIDNGNLQPLVGDATRIKQVLINLIGNAFKFTNSGKVEVEVEAKASVRKEHQKIKVTISDTGIGIDPNRLGLLFRPFSQGDSRVSKEYGGSGLGLVISKRLCEAMHGDVWIERTEVGKGSVFAFEIHLPKKVVGNAVCSNPELPEKSGQSESKRELTPSKKPEPESSNRSARETKPLRLLVVDDNPNNLLITSKLSQYLGYYSDTVTNGLEAIRVLEKSRYDIVLMDVRMAPLNGIETTRKIRNGEAGEHSVGAYIIALTAHALQGDKEKCMDAGMNDYLSKPLTLERLEESLNRARVALSLD